MPSLFGNIAGTYFIKSAIVSAAVVAKICDEWGDIFSLKSFGDFLGHHSLGHACASKGSDAVGSDVSLLPFFGQGLGKAPESKLGCGVVGLAESAINASA